MKLKDFIIFLLLGIAFIGCLIIIMNKLDNDFMNDCTSAGHSKEFCKKGLNGE